jgi:hypothetical protein
MLEEYGAIIGKETTGDHTPIYVFFNISYEGKDSKEEK